LQLAELKDLLKSDQANEPPNAAEDQ